MSGPTSPWSQSRVCVCREKAQETQKCHVLYYNDETSRRAGKSLECGDLSPLLPLWRLVAKAGPRPAARESWTPFRIGRRQVACRKRGQVRALESGCGSAALGSSVAIRGFNSFC